MKTVPVCQPSHTRKQACSMPPLAPGHSPAHLSDAPSADNLRLKFKKQKMFCMIFVSFLASKGITDKVHV